MVLLLAALLVLVLIAASVTVVDAVRASHWRTVALDRRQAWLEHAVEESAANARPLSLR
jgi:hypothetical protein